MGMKSVSFRPQMENSLLGNLEVGEQSKRELTAWEISHSGNCSVWELTGNR